MEVEKWPRLLLLGLLCPLVWSGCPSGFVKNGGACYYFSRDTATFAQAYPFCAQAQGSLFALPKSSDENKFFGDNTNFLATWLAVSYPLSETPPRTGEGYSNYDDANNYDPSNEGQTRMLLCMQTCCIIEILLLNLNLINLNLNTILFKFDLITSCIQ